MVGNRHWTEAEKRATRRLYECGHSLRDIAARTQRSVNSVKTMVNGYQNDQLAPMRPMFLLDGLSIETVRWLTAQIPKDGSLADVVRAIITDAFLDERER